MKIKLYLTLLITFALIVWTSAVMMPVPYIGVFTLFALIYVIWTTISVTTK